MLRITYSPPDGEPRQFEFTSLEEELRSREAVLIETSGGNQWGTFMEWALLMTQGSFQACVVLLWVLLRRENPALDLASLDFPVSALSVEETEDETAPEPEGKDEPGTTDTSSP